MKKEHVYNATAGKVNREIRTFDVITSVDKQIEEMQIEQTIPCSKRLYTIDTVIPLTVVTNKTVMNTAVLRNVRKYKRLQETKHQIT